MHKLVYQLIGLLRGPPRAGVKPSVNAIEAAAQIEIEKHAKLKRRAEELGLGIDTISTDRRRPS